MLAATAACLGAAARLRAETARIAQVLSPARPWGRRGVRSRRSPRRDRGDTGGGWPALAARPQASRAPWAWCRGAADRPWARGLLPLGTRRRAVAGKREGLEDRKADSRQAPPSLQVQTLVHPPPERLCFQGRIFSVPPPACCTGGRPPSWCGALFTTGSSPYQVLGPHPLLGAQFRSRPGPHPRTCRNAEGGAPLGRLQG